MEELFEQIRKIIKSKEDQVSSSQKILFETRKELSELKLKYNQLLGKHESLSNRLNVISKAVGDSK